MAKLSLAMTTALPRSSVFVIATTTGHNSDAFRRYAPVPTSIYGRMPMVWTSIREWSQKRTLRAMLKDPRAARGFRSIGQLEKGIGTDRFTTERLLLAVGARKSDVAEEWTLNPL